MENNEAEKLNQLHEALQVAAVNLINHLGTNHARIRIRDTTPALYITLSEGRHASGAEATDRRAQQDTAIGVQDRSPFALFARLRKA